MRLGLLGGSFDPVHYGHLLLAECCREQCGLDEVWFLPAATPPHKQGRSLTSAAERMEMLELAIGGQATFRVCRAEIDRGGVSYTVDTLASLVEEDTSRQLFFLLGADSLDDLPHWREPARICQLATLVVVGRPGAPAPHYDVLAPIVPPARLEGIRRHQVEMPPLGLSSSDIRQRVAAGQSIRYRTPRAVEAYIQAHKLYGTPEVSRPERHGQC
ncbi:MAG TPA: nicotinate-nucleotide adenylyltransferase [Pirellulales bacterium]|nr:nicotinate-nucleotide adenylyltransferase [Pirellulales bacterium]